MLKADEAPACLDFPTLSLTGTIYMYGAFENNAGPFERCEKCTETDVTRRCEAMVLTRRGAQQTVFTTIQCCAVHVKNMRLIRNMRLSQQ